MLARPLLLALMIGLPGAAPGLAQQPTPSGARADGCPPGAQAEAATPPARESRDGTAPGNAGSTGWSGGTGGSQIGTNPQGAVSTSRTWQPPTARGLDPLATPASAPQRC
ncbi:hypothetical protein [Roseicella frigidaeris]|uniref:Uncharacterized protein n=1 Tax=Roseicella frigidaeris TaxID=2230885 RepID=A0A327M4A1_9PROT|nr:hypothetical protein [Roseicella frigidaeris]RAI57780.1 hypothetical protein DOO78_17350 [Roseicella frigidaeris]